VDAYAFFSALARRSPQRRPEGVTTFVTDLEETLDLLCTPGALDEIRTAEAQIACGEAIGADELRQQMAQRMWVRGITPPPADNGRGELT
jgi:hypothetical protein